MPGPPEELMTRKNLVCREWHQKSPTYWHVTKLFLESEFQHKENKQMNSNQNLAFFLTATDSAHKISSNTTQKRTKQIWCQFSLLGQKPTFKYCKRDRSAPTILKMFICLMSGAVFYRGCLMVNMTHSDESIYYRFRYLYEYQSFGETVI